MQGPHHRRSKEPPVFEFLALAVAFGFLYIALFRDAAFRLGE